MVAAMEMAFVTPWLHVLYSTGEKTEALDQLAKNAQSRWATLADTVPDEEVLEGRIFREFRMLVMSAFAQVAQLMKSEGFSGENEVRTVVSTPFDASSKFRATESGIVRYLRLVAAPSGLGLSAPIYTAEVKAELTVPLLSVRLGPLLNVDTSAEVIKDLLDRNGYDGNKVTWSNVPLRP